MKRAHLNDMVKGWFVGDFSPTLVQSENVEVAIKHYKAGDEEKAHVHKVATEITAIVSGHVKLAGHDLKAGDILEIEPGEVADFKVIEDTVTVVVKLPSVKGDKYEVSNE